MFEQNVLEFHNVTKIYPGTPPVYALKNVSFNVRARDFTALVGPSGSGKSTILNLAAALDDSSDGEVRVAGQSLKSLSREQAADLRRRHLGFVFQSYNLFPTLTALENVEFTSLVRGDNAKDVRERATQALRDVGLTDMETRRPTQLSGGQQQRVAVARALVSQPAIILADEPTANLDSKTADQLIDLFENLNRQKGVTFLFSSHDLRLMERVRRRLILRDGEIVNDEVSGRELNADLI